MKKPAFLILTILIFVIGCEKQKVRITGHRGASGYAPENTLASMQKAIELGSDFSELDVQLTADSVIVLLHDESLKRTTGLDKVIGNVTSAEVSKLDAGSWFDAKFKGEPLPSLESVIEKARGKMRLNIELKVAGDGKSLAKKVVALVKKQNFVNDCIITSFNFDAINFVEKIDPQIKSGYIFSRMPDVDVFSAPCDLLSVNEKLVTQALVRKVHAHGKEVHVWTVNQPREMKRLISLGVDNIITNYPDVLFKIVK